MKAAVMSMTAGVLSFVCYGSIRSARPSRGYVSVATEHSRAIKHVRFGRSQGLFFLWLM